MGAQWVGGRGREVRSDGSKGQGGMEREGAAPGLHTAAVRGVAVVPTYTKKIGENRKPKKRELEPEEHEERE